MGDYLRTPLPRSAMSSESPRRALRPITEAEKRRRAQWWIDFRFVREVERLERDGRVRSRGHLEASIGLGRGVVADIRRGRRGCLPVHVVLLKQLYNADYEHILFGAPLNLEKSAPYVTGRGRINTWQPLVFAYSTPAGWKVGPQPEEDARHYPPDPTGAQWVPHELAHRAAKPAGAAPL